MAKKKSVQSTEVLDKPKATIKEIKVEKTNKWEIKDRLYLLKSNNPPLAAHLRTVGLYYFDEESGYEREISYFKNQKTVFIDEMQGQKRKEHIWFRDGKLFVPKNQVTLQKFLSLYHPQRDKTYYEHKPNEIAADTVFDIESQLDAMNLARDMDVDMAEAILRAEIGSSVSKMTSKELKRDLLVFAQRNPELFIELANDENVHLRNVGVKAVEAKIIHLSNDNRTFHLSSNNRKLMNVPFDEHPYSALAAWFKTDEGMEVYSVIEKKV